jgi:hypothetical protein
VEAADVQEKVDAAAYLVDSQCGDIRYYEGGFGAGRHGSLASSLDRLRDVIDSGYVPPPPGQLDAEAASPATQVNGPSEGTFPF